MLPAGFDLDAVIAKQGDHSCFAPSASAMWLTCSGSLIPNLLAPDTAGIDAATGTVAHGVGETWLKTGERPVELLGTTETVDEGHAVFEIEIDEEMLDYVEQYVDWCMYLPGEHHVEVRVDFSQLTPITGQGGTADHIACEPGVLTITDLKYGKGVKVFAEGNTQAQLYALGAFFEWDEQYHFERIVIRICQPRLGHFDVWEISRADLLAFADYAKERAYAAWHPNAPRTPDEKGCTWCKVKVTCPALLARAHDLVEGIFDDLDSPVTDEEMDQLVERLENTESPFGVSPPDPRSLTTEHLATLIPWRKLIENFFKGIEDELERRLEAGNPVPGFKMVEGRSSRNWSADETRMADTLELMFDLTPDDVFERSMISPAKLEGVLKKKGYKAKQIAEFMPTLVVKAPGKPVMAPASDKRPALSQLADEAFDDLDAEDDL